MQSRPAAERREELVALYREASGCLRCPLHESRNRVVFGNGNADADLMFIGEGPGQQEDVQGLPFVGRAGKLLDQLLEEIGLFAPRRLRRERREVQAARQPRSGAARDRLVPALPAPPDRAHRAEVICTLGKFAMQVVTRSTRGITAVHGKPAGARARQSDRARVSRLPPGGRAALTKTLDDLRAAFARVPALLEEPPPVPIGAVAPVAPVAVPEPDPPQMGLFG